MLRLLGIKGVSLPLDYINQNLRRLSKKYRPYASLNQNTTSDSSLANQTPSEFEVLRLTEIKVDKIQPQTIDTAQPVIKDTVQPFQERKMPTLHNILKDKLNINYLQNIKKLKQQNILTSAIYNLKLTKKGTKILKIIETVISNCKQLNCSNFIADIKSRTSFDTSKFLINLLTFSEYLYFRNTADTFEDRIEKALNFYFSTKTYKNLHLDDNKSIDSYNTSELLLESIYLTTDIQYKITSVVNTSSSNASIFELLFNSLKLNDKELIKSITEDKTSPDDLWIRKAIKIILNNKINDIIDIPDTFEDNVYRKAFCHLIRGDLDELKAKEICEQLPFVEDVIWFFSFYSNKYKQMPFENLLDLIVENYSKRGVLQIFHKVLINLFLGKYEEVINMLIKGQFYWESVVMLLNFTMFYDNFDKYSKQEFYNQLLDKFAKMNKLSLVKIMKEKFVEKQITNKGKLQVNNVLLLKDDILKEKHSIKYLEANILHFNVITTKNSDEINEIKKWVKETIVKKKIKLNYLCFLITVYKLHKLCRGENIHEGFKVVRKLDIFPTHEDKEEDITRKLKVFKNKEQNFKDIIGSCGVCLIELYWLKYKKIKEDGNNKLVKMDNDIKNSSVKEIKEDLNNIVYFYARSDDRGYDCILKYLMMLESLVI